MRITRDGEVDQGPSDGPSELEHQIWCCSSENDEQSADQLRESGRFPDLARKHHESGPRRTIEVLTAATARLAERGELAVEDPRVAAMHFAYLVIGEPLDTAMFRGTERRCTRRELHAGAGAGVTVFLGCIYMDAKLKLGS